MMRVAVIGAGPAGLTAAYQLAKAGVEVEVFEASDSVGGLARSFTLWDQTVDLGRTGFFPATRASIGCGSKSSAATTRWSTA
jgi:protoporphyrinogen oxidase